MKTDKRTAIAVGILFLTATASYLAGSELIASALRAPDHLTNLNNTQIRIGVVLELINCVAVVGIGLLMFPVLRKYNEGMALGYAGSRIMESVLLIVSAIGPLVLIAISQEYIQADPADASQSQTLEVLAMESYDLAFQMAMIALGAGSLTLCYVLYRIRLIPRALSALGFVGYIALLANGLLEIVGYNIGSVLFIPGGMFEAIFPIWLIVRGFDLRTMTSRPAGSP